MKYLKFSALSLFAVITLSFVVVKADDVYINGITVPKMPNYYTTNTVLLKTQEFRAQRVLHQKSEDNANGQTREIEVRTRQTSTPYTVSAYKQLTYNAWTDLNSAASLTPAAYKLHIKAVKNLSSTIDFWGAWYAY